MAPPANGCYLNSIIIVLVAIASVSHGQQKLENILEGKTLRAGVIEEPPWTIIRGGKIEGLAPNIFRKVAERLNFSVNFTKFHSSKFDVFIDEMNNCQEEGYTNETCDYDIGASAWTPTSERHGKVYFTIPIVESSNYVAVTRAEIARTKADIFLLFKPFSCTLWGLLVLFVLLRVLFSFLDHLWRKKSESERRGQSSADRSLTEHTSSSILMMLGQSPHSVDRSRRSTISWVADVVLAIAGLMVLLIYEATLSAMRNDSPKPASPLGSIEDFQKCRLDISKGTVPEGGAAHDFLNHKVLNSECNRAKTRKIQTCPNISRCLEQVRDGSADFAFTGSNIGRYFLSEAHCGKLTMVGKPFFKSNLAFVLPLKSPFANLIDRTILRLIEDGELPTLDDIIGECKATTQGPTTIVSELFYTVLLPAMVILVGLILIRSKQLLAMRRSRLLNDDPYADLERGDPENDDDGINEINKINGIHKALAAITVLLQRKGAHPKKEYVPPS